MKRGMSILKRNESKKSSRAAARAVVISETGKIRLHNEDNFCLAGIYNRDSSSEPIRIDGSLQPGQIAGVFDGMGGEECGEIASRIAAQTAAEFSALSACGRQAALAEMLQAANGQICAYQSYNGISSMGTTAVALLLVRDHAAIANVGDSRAYLFRGGKLSQLSRDHNELQTMLACGLLLPSEDNLKKKTALTQYLGVQAEDLVLEPSQCLVPTLGGDLFLLCSDGLTDMADDGKIAEILADTPFEQAGDRLVEWALEAGGRDNITLCLVRIPD